MNNKHFRTAIYSIAVAVSALLVPNAAVAGNIIYSLCYGSGIDSQRLLVVRDKKNNMATIFNGNIGNNECIRVQSSTGTGSNAEILVTLGQGAPYTISWINPNTNLNLY